MCSNDHYSAINFELALFNFNIVQRDFVIVAVHIHVFYNALSMDVSCIWRSYIRRRHVKRKTGSPMLKSLKSLVE